MNWNKDMNFKNWFENMVAKMDGIKGTVLDFLKDKLNIENDDLILSMSLKDIDPNIVSQLLNRGFFQNSSPDLLNDIKNGTLTVEEMINRLAGSPSNDITIPSA